MISNAYIEKDDHASIFIKKLHQYILHTPIEGRQSISYFSFIIHTHITDDQQNLPLIDIQKNQ